MNYTIDYKNCSPYYYGKIEDGNFCVTVEKTTESYLNDHVYHITLMDDARIRIKTSTPEKYLRDLSKLCIELADQLEKYPLDPENNLGKRS